MKKFLALALSGVMMLGLLAGCGQPAAGGETSGEKVVKIGIFEPASGDSASGGKKETLGMQYANKETPHR